VQAGIDPVNLLQISHALSALNSGLENQTLLNGLPRAALSAASTQTIALRTLIEQASDERATAHAKAEAVTAAIKNVDFLISGLISSLAQSNAFTVPPPPPPPGASGTPSATASPPPPPGARGTLSLDRVKKWEKDHGHS